MYKTALLAAPVVMVNALPASTLLGTSSPVASAAAQAGRSRDEQGR